MTCFVSHATPAQQIGPPVRVPGRALTVPWCPLTGGFLVSIRKAAVILAAGKGTRMNSKLPKAMHPIGNLPMVGHALRAARQGGSNDVIVICGPDQTEIQAFAAIEGIETVVQEERRGTGHAISLALPALRAAGAELVLSLFADTPLVEGNDVAALFAALTDADLVVAAFTTDDPSHYGRVLLDKAGCPIGIAEWGTPGWDVPSNANKKEKPFLANGGLMGFRLSTCDVLFTKIKPCPTRGEIFQGDLIPLLAKAGGRITLHDGIDPQTLLGANDRADLANLENIFQQRFRQRLLDLGVGMQSPDHVWFSYDTEIEADVRLGPMIRFGPGVRIATGAVISAFCDLEGTTVRAGALVGPFARLRPGSDIREQARIGNFVEIKNSEIDTGAKINHLSYIGDARVGEQANIGAGTITCNYDGKAKHRTRIGAHSFVGSNASLVAPLDIGEDALIGAGSVITKDVASGTLAVSRPVQRQIPGGTARLRTPHLPHKK